MVYQKRIMNPRHAAQCEVSRQPPLSLRHTCTPDHPHITTNHTQKILDRINFLYCGIELKTDAHSDGQ